MADNDITSGGNANKLNNSINGAAKVLTYIGVAGAAFMFLTNMAKTDRLQIEHNRTGIISLQAKVDKGESDHAFSLEKTAAMSEKFKEVETQFRNLDERTLRIEDRFARELLALDKRLQEEFQNTYVDASDILPRLAVVENYLLWIKRKIDVVPSDEIIVNHRSGDE